MNATSESRHSRQLSIKTHSIKERVSEGKKSYFEVSNFNRYLGCDSSDTGWMAQEKCVSEAEKHCAEEMIEDRVDGLPMNDFQRSTALQVSLNPVLKQSTV